MGGDFPERPLPGSHHSDMQAREATPKVTNRNDQQQEYCRGRWLCEASSKKKRDGKSQSATKQDQAATLLLRHGRALG